jgi:uroporphyrinogen-III synthase
MWIVTREAAEGQPLVDALKQRGHEAVCVPAIRREPLPWPEQLQPFGQVSLFLTSLYAAQLAHKNIDHTAVPPVGWTALEPVTASYLREWQLTPEVTAHGGSLALADAIIARSSFSRFLWPTSDAGLRTEEHAQVLQRMRDAHKTIDAYAVYTTMGDPSLDDNLRLLQGRVRFHAVLFSPSAARALHEALARTGVQGLARVVTVGASTTRAWPAPSTAAPLGVDIADFLCSLEAP